MKTALTILAVIALIAGCLTGCGMLADKSDAGISDEEQINSFEITESKQEQTTGEEKASEAKDDETSSQVEKASNIKNTAAVSNVQAPVSDPAKPTSNAKPEAEYPTTGSGTTIVGTFIIKKVSGTYLELYKLMGNDTEKLIYSCDLGSVDGFADMKYKAGDYITLRYDREIAETYPLQLTVREILPNEWNG